MEADSEAAIAAALEWFEDGIQKTPPGAILHLYLTETKNSDGRHVYFDDDRAAVVIMDAWAGNKFAEMALRKYAAERLSKGFSLPPNLNQFVLDVLNDRLPERRKRGQERFLNWNRDVAITCAVRDVVKLGYSPVRNRASREKGGKDSACSIVAQAIGRIGGNLSEAAVERIWRTYNRSTFPPRRKQITPV
jgi:hypothetical protein